MRILRAPTVALAASTILSTAATTAQGRSIPMPASLSNSDQVITASSIASTYAPLFAWSTSAGNSDPAGRHWLTAYADTFTDNQLLPLACLKDSAWSAGIYLPKLPKLPKLDFRAEGCFAPSRYYFPGFYFFNVQYLSGYTNNHQLIKSWIGREGNGLQLWTTWFSPRTSLQATYRQMSADPQFLRGGNLHDLTPKSEMRLGREWSVLLQGQFERRGFPLLFSNASANLAASAQLIWAPEWRPR